MSSYRDTMVEKDGVDRQAIYQIKVQGRLDVRWSDWFSGLVITVEDERGPSLTVLTGSIDQAALRGILNKLWDLNLTLVSVHPVQADEGEQNEETR